MCVVTAHPKRSPSPDRMEKIIPRHMEAVKSTKRLIDSMMYEKDGLQRLVAGIWEVMRTFTKEHYASSVIIKRLLTHLVTDDFRMELHLHKQPIIGTQSFQLSGKFQLFGPNNVMPVEFKWASVLSKEQQTMLLHLAYDQQMFVCTQRPMAVTCRDFQLATNADIQEHLRGARFNLVQVFVINVMTAALLTNTENIILYTHTALVDAIQSITAPGNTLSTYAYNQFIELLNVVQFHISSRKVISLQMELMHVRPGTPVRVSLRDSWGSSSTDSGESELARSSSGTLDLELPLWMAPESPDVL